MKTNQPSWHCIANLGDATPNVHGGAFVLIDKRGIYTPELWIVTPDDEDPNDDKPRATLCRVMLDECFRTTPHGSEVSDNKYHQQSPAWFDLESLASTYGTDAYSLASQLTSSNPLDRAQVYQALVEYYGAENFGGADPMTGKESAALCRKFLRQEKAAAAWKDGIS